MQLVVGLYCDLRTNNNLLVTYKRHQVALIQVSTGYVSDFCFTHTICHVKKLHVMKLENYIYYTYLSVKSEFNRIIHCLDPHTICGSIPSGT